MELTRVGTNILNSAPRPLSAERQMERRATVTKSRLGNHCCGWRTPRRAVSVGSRQTRPAAAYMGSLRLYRPDHVLALYLCLLYIMSHPSRRYCDSEERSFVTIRDSSGSDATQCPLGILESPRFLACCKAWLRVQFDLLLSYPGTDANRAQEGAGECVLKPKPNTGSADVELLIRIRSNLASFCHNIIGRSTRGFHTKRLQQPQHWNSPLWNAHILATSVVSSIPLSAVVTFLLSLRDGTESTAAHGSGL